MAMYLTRFVEALGKGEVGPLCPARSLRCRQALEPVRATAPRSSPAGSATVDEPSG
jgi:hypothetical protein